MSSELKFKAGDKVWDRERDAMVEIHSVLEFSKLHGQRYKVREGGKVSFILSLEKDLVSKDVPMFQEATERGLERRSRLPASTNRKAGAQSDGGYEPGDGSKALEMSLGEFAQALTEGSERAKRALENAIEGAKITGISEDMLEDPLKWIELLARYQRERLGASK